MGAFLLNIHDYIESVDIIDTHADFTPTSLWFGNNTNIVTLKQPAERFRFTFKSDANLTSKTIFFGDLIKSGPLTQATYLLNKYNTEDSYWKNDKWYHTFSRPDRATNKLRVECHGGSDFRIPGYDFEEWKQLINTYCNFVTGTDESNKPYFEITLPYTKNYVLNAHIGDYTITQQGSMNDCAFEFKDEFSRWTTKKAVCIVNGYLENFYKDVDDFTTDGENENVYYFNEQTETESQEQHIKKYFDSIEYSDVESNSYGWYFNMPFNRCTFKGVEYAYTGHASGLSSYWVDIKGIDNNTNFNRHYNILKADGFCQINKYNLSNFNGPYMKPFDNEVTIQLYNDVLIFEKDFSRLNETLYDSEFFPKNLKQYMNVLNTSIVRKTDDNATGLSANWSYEHGYFLKLDFTFDISELKGKFKPTKTNYFIFYFPRLIEIGKVSKNFITLPSSKYYQHELNEGDIIFSFCQPGGASSDYNDTAISTTGVHDDYCVSINDNTLDKSWSVYGADQWTLKDDVFTISCEIPLINHIVIKEAFENTIHRNSVYCLSEMFKQNVLCEIIYHNNIYYLTGIIPPYIVHTKSDNSYFLEPLTEKYQAMPNSDIMDNFKNIYTVNGTQDEMSIYNQYAKWYQNGQLYGGELYANIFCKSWMFRNISLLPQSRIEKNNCFSLPTIPIFKFDIVPSFPPNTYGEDYCPNDSVNECLVMPNDSIDYKNISELYESELQKDVIRLESYIKHIPLQAIKNDIVYELLGLLPGFGTVWKRGG